MTHDKRVQQPSVLTPLTRKYLARLYALTPQEFAAKKRQLAAGQARKAGAG